MTLTVEAPTDAQLAYVEKLARDKGVAPPVVYSKQHASILIDELRAGVYKPGEEPR